MDGGRVTETLNIECLMEVCLSFDVGRSMFDVHFSRKKKVWWLFQLIGNPPKSPFTKEGLQLPP
jgi:hypothetical protein